MSEQRNILVIDDDSNDVELVSLLLRTVDGVRNEVRAASSVEAGVDLLSQRQWDLCLLDYNLGGRTGIEVLAEAHRLGIGCPFVLMTGSAGRDADESALRAGASGFLDKNDLTREKLDRTVRYALANRERERGNAGDSEEARRTIQRLLKDCRRAEDADRAKSDLLATVSHEIRTPLNAILGMADLLGETHLDYQQRRYVDVFQRAGQNLLTLINDLLHVSRMDSGVFELERIEFDIEELIGQIVELVSPRAHRKGLDFRLSCDVSSTPMLVGDPVRLQQVLINLLDNAIKFTESGWVSLSVKGGQSSSSELTFAVSDSGIGIPADRVQGVFEDFRQADSSTTRKYGGTGLGLGIARRLVTFMGGELLVQSTPVVGSTFYFTTTFEVAESSKGRRMRGTEDFAGRRVVVIDDLATNRMILREWLESWGVLVAEFATVRGAIAALLEANWGACPELIVLDCRMPDSDGFEASRQLLDAAKGIPLLLLSSDDRPGDATRSQALGISGYAVRPLRRTQFLRLVADIWKTLREPAGTVPSAVPAAGPVVPERSRRVLVAEDAADNQFLVDAYLHGTEFELTLVENGRDAVEEFRRSHYDLILMDLLMPVMDGVEAVSTIRREEQVSARPRTPVIALSANARPQDVTASLNAGCDAHLSKPIAKGRLLDAMRRFSKSAPPKAAESAADMDIPEPVRRMASTYLAARSRDLEEIRESLAVRDWTSIRKLGHGMKGTGSGYGFPEISRIGAAIETSALAARPDEMEEHLRHLVKILQSAGAPPSQPPGSNPPIPEGTQKC